MDKLDKFINFAANDEYRRRLKIIAAAAKRKQSDYLRWLIDREYEKHTQDNGKDE